MPKRIGIKLLILSVEKLRSVADPDYVASCSINPILSCGSVMSSPQAEVFGIPHPFLGLVVFGALIAFGILLIAGGSFARWIWLVASSVALLGFLGMQYLVYQSIFEIKALCPWCMVVWVVSAPVFVGIGVYTIREVLHLKRYHPTLRSLLRFIEKQNINILIAWYLVVGGLILIEFWYYWSTLL